MGFELEALIRLKMFERRNGNNKIDVAIFYDEFLAIILDYLSSEIYEISKEEILLNDLEYLCDTIEGYLKKKEKADYFRSLLMQTVSAYNNQEFVNIMWYPCLENGQLPVMEVMGNMYCYKTGMRGLEKTNFVMLLKYMAELDLEEVKVDEKSRDKSREYSKSRRGV